MPSARILIQLKAPGALPDAVANVLRLHGIIGANPSHAELPGLFTASVPPEVALAPLIEALTAVPDVRYAEAEEMRDAF